MSMTKHMREHRALPLAASRPSTTLNRHASVCAPSAVNTRKPRIASRKQVLHPCVRFIDKRQPPLKSAGKKRQKWRLWRSVRDPSQRNASAPTGNLTVFMRRLGGNESG